MLGLVPHFIHEQMLCRNRQGEFPAAAMFVDISGFTPMTERLMKHGKNGAEVLSSILNDVLDPIIRQIYLSGGFVSGFAGDSFTAILCSFENDDLHYLANIIQNRFRKNRIQKTEFGDFNLTARIGISKGPISWGIVGKARKKAYFFRGEIIENSAQIISLCSPGGILYNNGSEVLLLPQTPELPEKEYSRSVDITAFPDITDTARRFILPEILELKELSGEFREIVPVFISFEEIPDFRKLNEFASIVLNAASGFGGYFNGLFFDDKGPVMLILFGAPRSYENNAERALEFLLSVRRDSRWNIRAGVSRGIAYTGIIGSSIRCTYTAIGDVVNTAARIMSKADWNQFILSENVIQSMKSEYETVSHKPFILKGKEEPVSVIEIRGGRRGVRGCLYTSRFVGRNNEIKKATGFLRPVIEKNMFGGVAYFYGEAGIGKSRFLYELSSSFSSECKTIILKADDVLRKSLNPFVSFLKTFFDQSDYVSQDENKMNFEEIWEDLIEDLYTIDDKNLAENIVDKLEHKQSVIGAVIGLSWGGSFYETLDAMGRFENILFSIREFFTALSLIQPIIILLEDLQWLDVDSRKAFQILTRHIDSFPIMIFVSSRFNDDGSRPDLNTDNSVQEFRIILSQLEEVSAVRLIENLLDFPPDENLSSFILSRSGGNPFYIEQFCLYLVENEIISVIDNRYKMTERELEIPSEIKAVLIARMDRLPGELRNLVQAASVLGQEFNIHVLAEMLSEDNLTSLLELGVKETLWFSRSDSIYEFKHALLRDAAYEMQLRKRLKNLHLNAANAIKALFPDDREKYVNLAHHYEKSGNTAETVLYLNKAADYARETYKNTDAADLYEKLSKYYAWMNRFIYSKPVEVIETITVPGFENIPVKESIRSYIEILINKANVLQIIGEWNRADKAYREAMRLAEKLDDDLLLAESRQQLGAQLSRRGKYDNAMKLLEQALHGFQKLENRKGIAKVLGRIGVVHWRKNNFDEAMKCLLEELTISQEIKDRREASIAFANMGIVEFSRGNISQVMEYNKKHLEISIELGDKREEAKALGNLGVLYGYRHEYSKTMECLEKELKLEKELGHKSGISSVTANMGIIHNRQGNYEKALSCYLDHLRLSEELGNTQAIANVLWNMGLLYYDMGDVKNAEEYFHRSLHIETELENEYMKSRIRIALGDVYKFGEEFAQSEKQYNIALEILKNADHRSNLCTCLYEKADLCYKIGRINDALELNTEAMAVAEESENDRILFNTRLLKNRILSTKNKETALTDLKKMLEGISEEQTAILFVEIFKLTKQHNYRKQALDIFKKLYKNVPKDFYRKQIEGLDSV